MKLKQTPTCLGFIMDGNRRWAREQGIETHDGHDQGGKVLKACVEWLQKNEIAHGVFYAFSTENWQRSEGEVTYLLELFKRWMQDFDLRVRVRFIGQREDFSSELREHMEKLERETAKYEAQGKTVVWIALSYGGRDEIRRAVNELVAEAVAAGRAEKVSEETFSARLDTADLPDPDMIVRTGGEQRLSNFLTWKSSYSELYFIEKYWPALTESDFDDILLAYASRERRRGT